MYLFFDTETTGLPKSWKAPVSDLANWPRLVQIAWLLYENDGTLIDEQVFVIRPVGFTISEGSCKVHGITTQRAKDEGVDLDHVLRAFETQLGRAEFMVAHNLSFDKNIVGAELLRRGMVNSLPSKSGICTMECSTDFCELDGPYGYKWPKLTELHHKLFGEDFEEAHDAGVDISATARCFWELRERGVV